MKGVVARGRIVPLMVSDFLYSPEGDVYTEGEGEGEGLLKKLYR